MQWEWLTELRLRWRALKNRKQLDRDLEDELGFHLAMKRADLGSGSAARREFGNATRLKETCRELWSFALLETFWKDFRFGVRSLVKSPGFACVAVLTLALGIGVNTSIFSVANTVLLRPLPYPDSGAIVSVWETYRSSAGSGRGTLCLERYRAWREQNTVLAGLAIYQPRTLVVKQSNGSSRVNGIEAGAALFRVLGVEAMLGRTFAEGEDQPGHNQAAVLSYAYWQRRFGGDRGVIGTAIPMDNASYTVIGVMPPEFQFPLFWNTSIWIPLATPPAADEGHSTHRYTALARLKQGVGLDQARAAMETLTLNLEKDADERSRRSVLLNPLIEDYVGWVRPVLLILCGAVAFVLLIASANVANLLLARALGRRGEVAIRAALGGGRGRLIRQFLTESLILCALGGGLGLALARWFVRLIHLTPYNVPRLKDVRLDTGMLAICAGVSILSVLLCGLLPAMQASRADLSAALKDSSRGNTGRIRLRSLLAAVEIGLTLTLLTAAGLMLRSLWQLQNVQTGFPTERLLTMRLPLALTRYRTAQAASTFDRRAVEAVAALPSVSAAGMISLLPPNEGGANDSFQIEGRPALREADRPFAELRAVSPNYFSTMGIPLVRGRFLTDRDDADAPHVALINQALAQRFFPHEDPIGARIDKDGGTTIVGIVGDVKNNGLSNSTLPELYNSYLQLSDDERIWAGNMYLLVRTERDAAALTPAIRAAIRKLNPLQNVNSVQTMRAILDASLAQPRFQGALLGAFAAAALLISMIGLYGVISYEVTERRHEIGVRMALGASRKQVVGLVLWNGMRIGGPGVVVGLAASLALTRVMRRFLFEVSPADPATFAATAALVAAAVLLAAYVPAWRATRVHPMMALRYE